MRRCGESGQKDAQQACVPDHRVPIGVHLRLIFVRFFSSLSQFSLCHAFSIYVMVFVMVFVNKIVHGPLLRELIFRMVVLCLH